MYNSNEDQAMREKIRKAIQDGTLEQTPYTTGKPTNPHPLTLEQVIDHIIKDDHMDTSEMTPVDRKLFHTRQAWQVREVYKTLLDKMSRRSIKSKHSLVPFVIPQEFWDAQQIGANPALSTADLNFYTVRHHGKVQSLHLQVRITKAFANFIMMKVGHPSNRNFIWQELLFKEDEFLRNNYGVKINLAHHKFANTDISYYAHRIVKEQEINDKFEFVTVKEWNRRVLQLDIQKNYNSELQDKFRPAWHYQNFLNAYRWLATEFLWESEYKYQG